MIPIRDDQPRFSTPYVNYFLIGQNIVVFLMEWLTGVQHQHALNAFLYEFGVVPRNVTGLLTGTPTFSPVAAILPIFTSMFLHASWEHVIGNMWFLWIFGDNIEDYLGHFKYLMFYLLSGVAAAFTQIALTPSSGVPSVGASGAIAGALGAYFVLYPRARVLTWFPIVFFFYLPAWVMLGYWFVVQFLSGTATSITATTQPSGGIAFWAHVGGFVSGVVLIKVLPQRPQRNRYATW